jgi:AcrR family transcriptional regulator
MAKVFAYPGTDQTSPGTPATPAAVPDPVRAQSSELVEFLEIAERRVRLIEQAADAAVEHVAAELERLLERLTAGADADAEKLREAGDVVIGHGRAVSEWSGAIARWLESEGAQHQVPSDGVILLARRMTIAGIPTRKIEALLAGLGVADPQAAVRHALQDPGA